MKRVIKFGDEARQLLLNGINLSTHAIKTTLGPKGSSAIIATKAQPFPLLADDGALVSKCIQSDDPVENAGCSIIREVATQTDDGGGDGTTSATLIAQAILSESIKNISAGASKRQLKKGIDLATKEARETIKNIVHKVDSEKRLYEVAFVSSNDEKTAELVSKAVYSVGKSGVVQVEEGTTQETNVFDVSGIKFNRGFIDRILTTDPVKGIFESKKTKILMLDHELDSVAETVKILELAITKGVPMLIICNDCKNGSVLAYLRKNQAHYGLKLCLVKAPGHGDLKLQFLQDISAATGATIIGDMTGISLEKMVSDPKSNEYNLDKFFNLLGEGDVAVNQNETTIVVQEKTQAAIDAAKKIEEQLENTSLTQYDRGILEERLANLTSGMAVIQVGGSTDTEIAAKKVKIDDAKNATVSANKYGYVIGGGSAYLWASKSVSELAEKYNQEAGHDPDILTGIKIVEKALTKVTYQLAENSGSNGDIIVRDIMAKMKTEELPKEGFNALTGEIVDMFESGIIDSYKVVDNSLLKASSIASTVILSETVITEELEESDKINYSMMRR